MFIALFAENVAAQTQITYRCEKTASQGGGCQNPNPWGVWPFQSHIDCATAAVNDGLTYTGNQCAFCLIGWNQNALSCGYNDNNSKGAGTTCASNTGGYYSTTPCTCNSPPVGGSNFCAFGTYTTGSSPPPATPTPPPPTPQPTTTAPTPAPTPSCSAQANCATSTSTCLASPNQALKTCSAAAAGYYVGGNGLVAQCATQTGCATHDASAVCVGTNQQRCTAASSGYKVVSHVAQPDCDFATTGAKAVWKTKCCGMPSTTNTGTVAGYPAVSKCGGAGGLEEKLNSAECGCTS